MTYESRHVPSKRTSNNSLRKRTSHLQNLMFCLQRMSNGEVVFTLSEGKLAKEFGFTTEQIYLKTPHQVFPPHMATWIEKNAQKAFAGENGNHELTIGERILFTSLSPIWKNGQVVEVIGSSIDITDAKRMETQVRIIGEQWRELNRDMRAQLEFHSSYDEWTGLPKRRLFTNLLSLAIKRAKQSGSVLAVVVLKIDSLDSINELWGYEAGDLLLRKVATILMEKTKGDAIVSRLGGHEFGLALPMSGDPKRIYDSLLQVRDLLSLSIPCNELELEIITSFGVSLYPNNGDQSELLLKQAHIALSRARETGSGFEYYHMEMKRDAKKRMVMVRELREAVEDLHFLPYYQPQYSLHNGNILGMEVLARWKHQDRGIIGPGEFIQLAEETGLIIPLGEWVLRTACMQWKEWSNKRLSPGKLAVNVSGKQFQQNDFVHKVESILEETGMDSQSLELEITESAAMYDTDKAVANIHALSDLGIAISIDDFGTGYSSFGYLKKFPIQKLKIERSFVRDLRADSDNEAIVSTIITMAHKLGMSVVAEGVETEEQAQVLRTHRCEGGQGYLFHRPMPAQDMEKLLKSNMNNSNVPFNTAT